MADTFITLPTGSTTDSSSSDSFDDSTSLSTPPSATHDTSRASFHVKDLEQFAEDLQNAADRAFPNQGRSQTRYQDVSVLLLRWEDDEMSVDWELEDLEKVFVKYGFGTESWLIPRKNPHLKLMSKAIEIVELHSDKDDLVVVYYAGHAFINNARQATWSCKSDPSYASLEWSAIQTLFEKASFDVLLLLDCCAAASAAPTVGSAVTETIAACGFENSAPQPGRHSFTNTLIEVLEDWIDSPPFSAAMLHNKVLSVLKHERPERSQNGKRRKIECRRTPIHVVATADPKLPSIELGRRIAVHAASSDVAMMEIEQSPDQTLPKSLKRKRYEVESLHEVTAEGFDVPRVVISLALEETQVLSSEACEKWLSSCPALIKYASVEAVYKSFSTLVILSIPVLIWDLLPDNPACSFVGYATSPNIMKPLPATEASDSVLAEIRKGQELLWSQYDKDGKPRHRKACSRCRARRIKCDWDADSCKSCRRAGQICIYSQQDPKVMVHRKYLEELERKLVQFEALAKTQQMKLLKPAPSAPHNAPVIISDDFDEPPGSLMEPTGMIYAAFSQLEPISQNVEMEVDHDNEKLAEVAETDNPSPTLDSLQRALQEAQDVQKAQKRELGETIDSYERQLQDQKSLAQELDILARRTKSVDQSLQTELNRLALFEKEMKEKNLLIGKLRHEAIILNDHLTKALRFLKKTKPEDINMSKSTAAEVADGPGGNVATGSGEIDSSNVSSAWKNSHPVVDEQRRMKPNVESVNLESKKPPSPTDLSSSIFEMLAFPPNVGPSFNLIPQSGEAVSRATAPGDLTPPATESSQIPLPEDWNFMPNSDRAALPSDSAYESHNYQESLWSHSENQPENSAHESSIQALNLLQKEHDELLAAFARFQTRANALEKKHTVSDSEIVNLTEEKLRLQAQVIEMERELENLARSRDEYRQAAVHGGAQYVEIVKMASRLERMSAEERKHWTESASSTIKGTDSDESSGMTTPTGNTMRHDSDYGATSSDNSMEDSTTVTSALVSPTSSTYSRPPPQTYAQYLTGLISPPESRRTSDNKSEPPPSVQTKPSHRQPLPSIHEALGNLPKSNPYPLPTSTSSPISHQELAHMTALGLPPSVSYSSLGNSVDPHEDWAEIHDLADQGRIQNNIAQEIYRTRLKRRLEDLEERGASSSDLSFLSYSESTDKRRKDETTGIKGDAYDQTRDSGIGMDEHAAKYDADRTSEQSGVMQQSALHNYEGYQKQNSGHEQRPQSMDMGIDATMNRPSGSGQ